MNAKIMLNTLAINDLSCVMKKKTILIRLHTMKATKESCESTENFIDTHKERKIDKTKNDWDYLHA